MARVQQAERDLAAAQEGITEQTPLAQAGQQFGAAAVALEVSWLALLADAGCLTDEQQQAAAEAVRAYTAALQQALAVAAQPAPVPSNLRPSLGAARDHALPYDQDCVNVGRDQALKPCFFGVEGAPRSIVRRRRCR